jgi:parallel beta-helix repeat protein
MSIPSTGINIERVSKTAFNGNILYVGGSGPGNYTKIQDAIDDASDGDTVFVYNGTYVENLVVDKSIKLIGEDRDTTVIDGNNTGNVVNISVDGISIRNFTIQNGVSNAYGDGLKIEKCNNSKIIGNIITNNRINGISLFHSYNNIFKDNYFELNYYGINSWSSNYTNILNNYFSDNYFSIQLAEGNYNIIRDNHIELCYDTPIHFWGDYNTLYNNTINSTGSDATVAEHGEIRVYGNNNIIKNNILINYDGYNLMGIKVLGEHKDNVIVGNYISSYADGGILIRFGINCTISNNILRNNGYFGIDLEFCRKNKIVGNIIENNEYGVSTLACKKNNFSYNDLIKNNIGIALNSCFTKVVCNNFINNNKSAEFRLFSFFNKWNGNFWDKPRSLPYPIIGYLTLGVFFPIPWINFDWNPAKEPYDIGV